MIEEENNLPEDEIRGDRLRNGFIGPSISVKLHNEYLQTIRNTTVLRLYAGVIYVCVSIPYVS